MCRIAGIFYKTDLNKCFKFLPGKKHMIAHLIDKVYWMFSEYGGNYDQEII
jgi:hypothetical protein